MPELINWPAACDKTVRNLARLLQVDTTLSGGERNRVHLAKTLSEGANVMLLDEPTNDVDLNTLRALEEALEDLCAAVVSHGRWRLDRICTHIIAFEGDSQVRIFLGHWSDYEAFMKKHGKDLAPRRVKYRTVKRWPTHRRLASGVIKGDGHPAASVSSREFRQRKRRKE